MGGKARWMLPGARIALTEPEPEGDSNPVASLHSQQPNAQQTLSAHSWICLMRT